MVHLQYSATWQTLVYIKVVALKLVRSGKAVVLKLNYYTLQPAADASDYDDEDYYYLLLLQVK